MSLYETIYIKKNRNLNPGPGNIFAAVAAPGNPVGVRSLDPTTELLDPNLHFNETPG